MKAKEAMQALIEVCLALRKAKAEDDAKHEELDAAEKELRVAINEEGTENQAQELLGKVFALRKERDATTVKVVDAQRLYEVRADAFLAALKKGTHTVKTDERTRFYCDGWIAVVSIPGFTLRLHLDDMYQVEAL